MSTRLVDVRRQLDQKASRVGAAYQDALADRLRRTAPVKTGQLRDSQKVTVTATPGQVRWNVEATAPHAVYQSEGTRPHIIRARNASALVFYWPKVGRVVAFKQVSHPGTKPNRWFRSAVEEFPEVIERLWRRF
jgi:hypothetical protein